MLAGLAVAGLTGQLAPSASPPAAPRTPVVDQYYGTQVFDDYWGLEYNDDRTKAWTLAQSAHSENQWKATPAYDWFHRRVKTILRNYAVRSSFTLRNARLMYLRKGWGHEQGVLMTRDTLGGTPRALYDPGAQMPRDKSLAIASIYPNYDASLVAFTTTRGGTDDETLHLLDVRSGRLLPEMQSGVGSSTSASSLVWDMGSKGFYYTYSRDQLHQTINHHRMGTSFGDDASVALPDKQLLSSVALAANRDGTSRAAILTADSASASKVYSIDRSGRFTLLADAAAGIIDGVFRGGEFLMRRATQNGHNDVVTIGADGKVTVFIPASERIITQVIVAGERVFTVDLADGESALRSFTLDGHVVGDVALPTAHANITDVTGDEAGKDVVVSFVSYSELGRVYRYLGDSNSLELVSRQDVPQTQEGRFIVRRVKAVSSDGTRVPLTIVHLNGVRPARSTPVVLNAYGAYGNVFSPVFIYAWKPWLERGYVLAYAGVRGGGEYGEAWHRNGMLARKTNGSDDLAACARWLQANGYADSAHLGLHGASAGGFLAGLALARDPGLYGAVVTEDGFFDLIRLQRSANGRSNTGEFGDTGDPDAFKWMLQQSPYHHLRARHYPPALLLAGGNDVRVDAMQSRKMAAKLGALSKDSQVFLIQDEHAGHVVWPASRAGEMVALFMAFYEKFLSK